MSSEVQQLRRQDGRLIAEVELAHDEEDFTTLLLHPVGGGATPRSFPPSMSSPLAPTLTTQG